MQKECVQVYLCWPRVVCNEVGLYLRWKKRWFTHFEECRWSTGCRFVGCVFTLVSMQDRLSIGVGALSLSFISCFSSLSALSFSFSDFITLFFLCLLCRFCFSFHFLVHLSFSSSFGHICPWTQQLKNNARTVGIRVEGEMTTSSARKAHLRFLFFYRAELKQHALLLNSCAQPSSNTSTAAKAAASRTRPTGVETVGSLLKFTVAAAADRRLFEIPSL